MQPATRTAAADESEPLRIAALDTAQQLDDVLSAWVELVADLAALNGPRRTLTTAERAQLDPPGRYEIATATRWLVAQIEHLVACEGIGDLWGELAEVMSQAHALAPWRQQATRLPAIECPCCHRPALTLFGGDEDVTCTACHEIVPWARYAVWVKMLAEQRGEAS